MHNILICDDDRDIVSALKIYLNDPDRRLFCAYNGREAIDIVDKNEIHLILMDIMMPEVDGITAMALIRENHNMPIIMLTAKSEDNDVILGLNVGADDYITKPFNPLEVAARVNSQLRRYTRLGAGRPSDAVYRQNGIELDDVTKTVTVDGKEVTLTPKEYDILKLLISTPGRVYSPGDIYRAVWKEEPFSGNDNTVAVHIRHLREKIEFDANDPRCIKVIFGHGYRFEKERSK